MSGDLNKCKVPRNAKYQRLQVDVSFEHSDLNLIVLLGLFPTVICFPLVHEEGEGKCVWA